MLTVAAFPTIHAISLVAIGVTCLLVFILLMVYLAWSNPGRNAGFLEWDPEATATWKGAIEDHDLVTMLEMRNAERERAGLEPQDLETFRDELRRKDRP